MISHDIDAGNSKHFSLSSSSDYLIIKEKRITCNNWTFLYSFCRCLQSFTLIKKFSQKREDNNGTFLSSWISVQNGFWQECRKAPTRLPVYITRLSRQTVNIRWYVRESSLAQFVQSKDPERRRCRWNIGQEAETVSSFLKDHSKE